jgi:hypothetical protein
VSRGCAEPCLIQINERIATWRKHRRLVPPCAASHAGSPEARPGCEGFHAEVTRFSDIRRCRCFVPTFRARRSAGRRTIQTGWQAHARGSCSSQMQVTVFRTLVCGSFVASRFRDAGALHSTEDATRIETRSAPEPLDGRDGPFHVVTFDTPGAGTRTMRVGALQSNG